uniref:Cytochrome P450 n=1 Tax=Leersia perrieri TaxID=77586 RepID=A0A0D9VHC3_9ORYZ
MELWLLVVALAVSLLYYLSILRRYARGGGSKAPLPPGPTPLPLIGNLHNLRGDVIHHRLTSLARVHGPVMLLRFGLTRAVVISSRDAAAEAYTKHDRRLAARLIRDTSRAYGLSERSTIWLPSSNPRWKTLRGIQATHLFSPRGMAAVHAIRERKVRDIVAYFRSRAGNGEEVLFGQAIYSGVLNLVSSSFFSVNMIGAGSEESHGLRDLVEDLLTAVTKPNVSDIFPFLQPFDLQGIRRWTAKRLEKAFGILNGIIDRRLADYDSANGAGSTEKGSNNDFLDALLGLVSDGKMAREDVTVLLLEIFGAGSDTMSVSLEWAMAELLRNPDAMAKVRAELKDVLGDKKALEEADAARLPYLQAVLKESMRLHPVGPILLPHYAEEDGVVIGGYAVPKDTAVLFNASAIMRDPAAWEKPDEFMPERFMRSEHSFDFRGKDFEFIPFGSGRRLCPGVPLAERLVPFILASLLHAFEWRLPGGMSAHEMDLTERFSTTNCLAVPLKVVLTIN